MALKNTYTKKGVDIFGKIQKILATSGAKRVYYDYDNAGQIMGLAFMLELNGQEYPFKMPARIENVGYILNGLYWVDLTQSQKDQAYRVAWANIRDWLDSQIAMKDIGLVTLEEVFLPYLVVKGEQTLFENMRERQFLLGVGDQANG
ncbi:MAG TPA: hypothetical protein VF679_01050 [Pedobacter sp.]|jgi:hypothetical protein